jgi:hypothetical protein
LSLDEQERPIEDKLKTLNRTGEIPPSGIIGGPGKRDAGGNVYHLVTERAGMGTLHLTVGASELYPTPEETGE